MKRVLIIFLIISSCSSDYKAKEQLKEVLRSSGYLPFIRIENYQGLDNEQHFYLLSKFTIEDVGVKLNLSKVGNGLTDVNDTKEVFIYYDSINISYLGKSDFTGLPDNNKIVIVLK